MKNNKRINFTNLATTNNNEYIYLLITIAVILVCALVSYFIFFYGNEEEPPIDNTPTSSENINPPDIKTSPDNTESDYSKLNEIDKKKADTFLVDVQLLYKRSQLEFVNQYQKGNILSQMTPENVNISDSLNYCIKLNDIGSILVFQAENDDFNISMTDIKEFSDIKVDNIKIGKLKENNCK